MSTSKYLNGTGLSEVWTNTKNYIASQLLGKSNVGHTHSASEITSGLATVATSGSYNDLSNKPTIPTVNNATLTIQKNGTTVKTFTANASSNVTANITVPTKTSDLTNDSHVSITTETDTTSTGTPAHGGTFTCIDSVTRDSNGHVTKVNTKTVTLPSDSNTDTLVTQNVSTANENHPILLSATKDATTNQGAKTSIFASGVKVNPSTGTVTATAFSGNLTGNVTGNVSGSSGSCTGNAATASKLATARSISAGDLEFQGSANFDGSGNIKLNITHHRSLVTIGNTNNYPFHRIAYTAQETENWLDRVITFFIGREYSGGGYGICRIVLRTSDAARGATASCVVEWLVRTSSIPVDAIQVGFNNTAAASYVDVFYKSSESYSSAICRVISHASSRTNVGQGFAVVSTSSEVNNTTTSDPLTSTESYATIAAAGTKIRGKAYTSTITASDAGIVNYATYNANGKELVNSIIKGLSVSGRTITYTKLDGSTGTLTTQDTNTTYSNFVKSGSGAAAGLVPAPSTTAGTTKYLREDGTWQVPPDHTYNVYNKTLTIQKNGTNVATFTSNSNTDVTANISVPTKTSDLTNDSGFLTSHQDLSGYIPKAGGAVMTGPVLGRTNNTSSLTLCGGTGYDDGASIDIYGTGFSLYGLSGAIRLSTCSSLNPQMYLYSNGTWTWSGQPVQTSSDQRLKQQITEIDEKLLDAWEDVELSQFKYNDAVDQKGDNARLHTGYVVQQIDNACKSHNLDISEYGLYCHEEYPQETEEVEVENEDGTTTKETKVIKEASEHYSLRYTEALIVECAYLRKCIKELRNEIEELKSSK